VEACDGEDLPVEAGGLGEFRVLAGPGLKAVTPQAWSVRTVARSLPPGAARKVSIRPAVTGAGQGMGAPLNGEIASPLTSAASLPTTGALVVVTGLGGRLGCGILGIGMLCQHLTGSGTAPDGRLFCGARCGMLSQSVYGRAWHAAR